MSAKNVFMLKMHGLVHCHVCPLKEVCEEAEPEVSYRHANEKYDFYDKHHFVPETEYSDWRILCKVTLNCPLKRKIEKE
jgi:hypothetical protein